MARHGRGFIARRPISGRTLRNIPQPALSASETVTASLSSSRTLTKLLLATITESTLPTQRSYGKLLTPPETMGASVQITKRYVKPLTASITEAVNVVHGAAFTKQFPVAVAVTGVFGIGQIMKVLPIRISNAPSISSAFLKNLLAAVGETGTVTKYVSKSFSVTGATAVPVLIRGFQGHVLNGAVLLGPTLHLGAVYPKRLTTTPVIIVANQTHPRLKLLTPHITISPVLTLHDVRSFRIAAATVTVNTLPLVYRTNTLLRASETMALSLNARVLKSFRITLAEIAILNKGGRFPQPAAVLQMYDIDDFYRLHALKGATVSYMHGIFGVGVAFDIYGAYVLAGNQSFYVCDNGIKESLDKAPSLIRVQ